MEKIHECKSMGEKSDIYFETSDWDPGWKIKLEDYCECPPLIIHEHIKFCPFCGVELK